MKFSLLNVVIFLFFGVYAMLLVSVYFNPHSPWFVFMVPGSMVAGVLTMVVVEQKKQGTMKLSLRVIRVLTALFAFAGLGFAGISFFTPQVIGVKPSLVCEMIAAVLMLVTGIAGLGSKLQVEPKH